MAVDDVSKKPRIPPTPKAPDEKAPAPKADDKKDPKPASRVAAEQKQDGFEANPTPRPSAPDPRSDAFEPSPASSTAPAPDAARQTLSHAKDLQSYAEQKIQEIQGAHLQVPQGLLDAKNAADRNVGEAVKAVDGKTTNPTSSMDAKLLERLERGKQADALQSLNRSSETRDPKAADPKDPNAAEAERRRVAGLSTDSATQDRLVDKMAKRLGKDPSKLTDAERDKLRERVNKLSKILGKGNVGLGNYVLEKVLDKGRLHLGLAGIHGPKGGPRSPEELEQTRQDMGKAVRGEVDAVLDNDNGARGGLHATPNAEETQQLADVMHEMADLKIPVDITSHSNGFNALAKVAREAKPPVHFGHVNLVNPNVPGTVSEATKDMKEIVAHSDRVSLTTSIDDDAIPFSAAGLRNAGQGWKVQIAAAARAGVSDITVFNKATHDLASVGSRWDAGGPDLSFHKDANGRFVPNDPEAWYKYTLHRWTGDGFERAPYRSPYAPRPAA
jgi:hypothetical protein